MTVSRLARVLTVLSLLSGCNACSGPNRDAGGRDGRADEAQFHYQLAQLVVSGFAGSRKA